MMKQSVRLFVLGIASLVCATSTAELPKNVYRQANLDRQVLEELDTNDVDLAAKLTKGRLVSETGSFMQICTGKTAEGSTDWMPYGANATGVFVDINTAECGFDALPIYIVNMHGNSENWETTGGSSAYLRTASGFRVYVRYWNGSPITPDESNQKGWHIQWIAIGN